MYEKLSEIAEKYNLILLFMKTPDKVRAFIVEAENGTYIIVMIFFLILKKKKRFTHEMLHFKLGHLENYDKSKIDEYEAEVDRIMRSYYE